MMEQTRLKREKVAFMLGDKVYTFDSMMPPLCLSVFLWAKFRKKKGDVKAHLLYDIEALIPAFYHITTTSVNASKTMKEIPYETDITTFLTKDTTTSWNYFSDWNISSLS